jgi:hypothetical protein
MAEGIEVPDLLFQDIPVDATPKQKLYMRAQLVLQSAFYTFGSREHLPDTATLDRQDLVEVLGAAISMLVAADPQLKTNRDLRLQAEAVGKFIKEGTLAMRAQDDNIAELLLEAMGLWHSTPH